MTSATPVKANVPQSSASPPNEVAIRQTGQRLILAAQAALATAVVVAIMLNRGAGYGIPAAALACLGASLAIVWQRGNGDFARMSVSAMLMAQVMLLVAATTGHIYQMDMHMAFFSALGLVAFMICWRSILVATLAVAIHHLSLNLVFPAAVFPNGADIARVLLHAVILIVEAGALLLLAQHLSRAFADNAEAVKAAERSQADAQSLSKQSQATQIRDTERRAGLEASIASFSSLIGETMRTAEQEIAALQSAAQSLSQIAAQSCHGVDLAAGSASEAAENVGTMAEAAGELSKSLGEIAGQVQSTSETVTAVRGAGEESLRRMDELSMASERIGNVITLIQTIAGQTNLLALNATIEAARAGDAGRGFAIVASEVKTLAAQTGKATDEISTQVQEVQRATLESVEAIKAIVARMVEVDQFMSAVAISVERQDETTRDMSQTMSEAARNAAMSSGNLRDLKEQAEKVGEVAASVLGAAGLVQDATGTVQGEVSKFIAVARAS